MLVCLSVRMRSLLNLFACWLFCHWERLDGMCTYAVLNVTKLHFIHILTPSPTHIDHIKNNKKYCLAFGLFLFTCVIFAL